MAQTLLNIAADFDTQLTGAVSIGDTTATIASATDDDGNALPAGTYGFTIDAGNSSKEYIVATISGTSLSSISTINRQGTTTSGFARSHRRGAKVTITDWAILSRMFKLLNADNGFNASTPIKYDAHPTFSNDHQIIDKKYADDLAIAGSPDASTTVKGISKLTAAPTSPTDPIAVGENDTRLPSQGENDALAGTSGTPSSSNKYVTNDDTAEAATASKLARRKSTGDVTVPTTPTATTDAASKAYVDAGYAMTIPLGESFTGATTPQPAVIINDLAQLYAAGASGFGLASSYGTQRGRKLALKIVPRSNVTSSTVNVSLIKIGAPTDNITVTIETDSAGSPSGTPVTNGTSNTVAGTTLTTTESEYTAFTFASAFSMSAGTTYWAVLNRSGANDDSNYYAVPSLASTTGYASFSTKYNNGAWVAGNVISLEIIPSSGSGSLSLWQSDANASDIRMAAFDGFCTTTGSAGDSGTIVFKGQLSGFSGLIPQTEYNVSQTKGAITTTAIGQYVGTATSATQIMIPSFKKSPYISYGSNIGNTFSVNGIGLMVLKAPSNGTLNVYSGATATISVLTSDSADMTANPVTFSQVIPAISSLHMTVPVRKNQYFKITSATSSATAYFMPESSI